MESSTMYRTLKLKRVTPPRRWNLRTDRLPDIPAGLRLTAQYFAVVRRDPVHIMPPSLWPFAQQVRLFGWSERPR